jgi:hypothetical protein
MDAVAEMEEILATYRDKRDAAVEEARRDRAAAEAAGEVINPKALQGRKKAKLHLLPQAGLVLVSEVMKLGAEKYDPMNWRDTPIELTDYEDAIFRHLLAVIDGEDVDPESGQSHMAHIAATALIVLDAEANGTLIDNRPTPGESAGLIRDLKA